MAEIMEKNTEINVNIENYGCNGEGVAKINGEVVFLPYTIAGENIDATIIKANKKFSIGKIKKINLPSENRITPPCPYYSKCGGCVFQHMIYENSLAVKTEIVQNAISHIGKIDYTVPTVIKSPNEYHYRNKIALPVNPKTRRLGMFRLSSHNIVDIDDCLLQKDLVSKLIKIFNEYLQKSQCSIYDEATGKGILKHFVAREINKNLLVTVVINGDDLQDKNTLIEILSKNFDNVGISLNINKLNNNVILTDKFVDIFGENYAIIEEYGIKYQINNQSFLQVNDDVKKMMYQKIFEEIENETVIDAYSGAGLLSAMISKHAKEVFGIEIVKEATILADNLKKLNNISNLVNINGDCSIELPKLISKLSDEQIKNLSVVLDPPRKGCDKKVIDAILEVLPNKIIYMSCDPSTLSRDLNLLLSTKDYNIKYIQPYDMFPQTKHIETIAVLIKK